MWLILIMMGGTYMSSDDSNDWVKASLTGIAIDLIILDPLVMLLMIYEKDINMLHYLFRLKGIYWNYTYETNNTVKHKRQNLQLQQVDNGLLAHPSPKFGLQSPKSAQSAPGNLGGVE